MTQVKEWSNQELNRNLAAEMNYIPLSNAWDDYHQCHGMIPRWSSDPAASLEVQTAACKVDGERYIWELAIIQGWVGGKIISRKEGVRIATATPRERAEAAYITLQGAT